MVLTVFLIMLTAVFELGLHALPAHLKSLRSIAAGVALAVLCGVSVALIASQFNLLTFLILFVMVFRIFNLMRVLKGRMHQQYLWQVSYRTGLALASLQLGIVAFGAMQSYFGMTGYGILAVLAAAQLSAAIIMLLSIRGHSRRMRNFSRPATVHMPELPSVTIAIPARNETETLHECIASLLASQYPKLEILVLDDCSQTTRTPEIIKSFAHDGVRFIQGAEPSETWLAKNRAYDKLSEEASGDWLVFAGVDIRLEPDSIRQLVSYALNRQKKMVCVMPHNVLYHDRWPLIQPMRYVWELAFPRRALDKPPVLSSLWLIERQALEQAGGFEAASRMVVPEAYFAKQLLKADAYSFLASGTSIGVTSVKDIQEQRDTAIRVAYPQVHRRPEAVAAITLGYAAWIAVPLIILLLGAVENRADILIAVSMVVMFVSGMSYAAVLRLAYGKAHILHVLSFPVAVLVYVSLLNYSMFRYEFSEVTWKGRNVCLPVMHVIPKLPKL